VAGIKVVTDSMSDIPSDLLARYNIDVVPLDVRLGTEGPKELIGLTAEEFWHLVRATGAFPETSAPSPGAFIQAFLHARDEGFDGVCCITFSSALSATYQAACLGAKEVQGDVAVRVIDSRWGTILTSAACRHIRGFIDR
jgi:DegV family protein with EDD domain